MAAARETPGKTRKRACCKRSRREKSAGKNGFTTQLQSRMRGSARFAGFYRRGARARARILWILGEAARFYTRRVDRAQAVDRLLSAHARV